MPPKTRRNVLLITLVLVVLAGSLAACLAVGLKLSRLVSDALTRALGRPASVSGVGIDLLNGVSLYNLRIQNPPGAATGNLLEVKSINIMPDLRELAKGRVVLLYAGVRSPRLSISRTAGGAWNFEGLLKGSGRKNQTRFTLRELVLTDGKIEYGGRQIAVREARLTGFSSAGGGPVSFSAAIELPGVTSLALNGWMKDLDKEGRVELRAAFKPIELASLAPYLPNGPALSGRVVPGVISLGGSLKPLRLAVSGDIALTGAGYKGCFKAGAELKTGATLKNPYLFGKLNISNPAGIMPASGPFPGISGGSADISVSLKGEDIPGLSGAASVRLAGVDVLFKGKPLLKDVSAELKPAYKFKENEIELPRAAIWIGKGISLGISGRAVKGPGGWSASGRLELPETGLQALQEETLDALPAALRWADVSGFAGASLAFSMAPGGRGRVSGRLDLRAAAVELPDKGISIGPADGTVPIEASFGGGAPKTPDVLRGEGFEKGDYQGLLRKYEKRPPGATLAIKKASFGFIEADDIGLKLRPGDGYYELGWFGFAGLGGRVYGYGTLDYTGKEPRYALSVLLSDLSLSRLCGMVPSIKGYISGRVSGLARVVVKGSGYEGITGAGYFWAADAGGETRKISKTFLKKLMGASLKKYMFVGDRGFDTGELEVVFSGGDIVFNKLLISNRNFLGYQDLNITVAPVSNRISVEQLLDTIKEVGARAAGAGEAKGAEK